MKEGDIKYYDIPGFARPLTEAEVAALNDMFEHPGWRVFISLRKIEADSSMQIGMSLTTDESNRIMHRALYHGFNNDLTFEPRLREGVSASQPVAAEELDHLYHDLQHNREGQPI